MTEFILLDIAKGWKTGIMIVLMIAVFYFFLIRPQSQKAKKEQAYRDSLQKGDRLMTAGGIHVTFISGTLQPIPEHKEK